MPSSAASASLDGIYIIRTPVPATELDAPAAVTAYKNLARVDRDFRSLNFEDLDLPPLPHCLEERVRSPVRVCMLAGYPHRTACPARRDRLQKPGPGRT